MKKAFIDLDGTLIDSKARHISVLHKALRKYCSNNLCIDDFLRYKADGYSTKDYLEKKLQIDSTLIEKIFLKWVEMIELDEEIMKDVWYDDALDFLTFLKTNGFQVIIVSARKNREGVLKFIEKSKVNRLLDEIMIVSPIEAKTKKKEYILHNLGDINIVIGDTEADCVEYTKITNFMLNRGFRSKNYWENKKMKSYNSLRNVMHEIEKEERNGLR